MTSMWRLPKAGWCGVVLALCMGRADSDSHPRAIASSLGQQPAALPAALAPTEPEATPLVTAEALPEPSVCRSRIAQVMASPGLPSDPELEQMRDRVLLYAKGEPVHFSKRPSAANPVSAAARSYRSMLAKAHSPWGTLQRLASVFASNPELGRAVLLREGYLYADEPKLAFALVDLVSAQLLFNQKQLWLQRGERLLRLERSNTGHYVYVDGAEQGQRARLMLYDRIGVDSPPAPLHRDFRALRQRLGFERARVIHETEAAMVVELGYGGRWVRSLLEVTGAHLELACELTPEPAWLERHRAEELERLRLLEPLQRVMRQQVDEGLPFDEPLTEYGQQDGQLRPAWQRAYETGHSFFELNDDRYYVFDREGRPRVPQVCIDFIFDTFERAGGSWWRARGEPRTRSPGRLNLGQLSQLNLRRASSIVELAQARPDLLEVYTLPESERIPFKWGDKLANYLSEQADRYRPGDIVIIRGYAPWDKPWKPRVMHQHSFFVYESDPLSGMPMVLAGNPGQPVLQTWQFEAFRTPERAIQHRVRPKLAWLRQFIQPAAVQPAAAPLSVEPRQPRVPLDLPTAP
jgi:hypothetical protein